MKRRTSLPLASTLVLLVYAGITYGHSGGTNAEGCHTNRKTGDYHCHTRKAPPLSRTTYCHVLDGERRCGYARGSCEDLVSQFGGRCVIK